VAAVGARARLMLHFHELAAGSPVTAKVREVVASRPRPAEDLLVLPDSGSLTAFREAAPAFGYALALGEKVAGWVLVDKAVKLGLKVIRPHRSQVDGALVRRAHEKSLQVFVHFADEEEDLKEMLRLRVDGILTGRPELLKQLREAAPRTA